jgi:hypothetical protein
LGEKTNKIERKKQTKIKVIKYMEQQLPNMMLTPEHRRSTRPRAPRKNTSNLVKRISKTTKYQPKKLYYDDEGKYDGDELAGLGSKFYKKSQINDVDTDSEEEKETSYSSMEEWVSCDYSDCDEKIDPNNVGDDYNLSIIGGGYACKNCLENDDSHCEDYENTLELYN